MPEGVSFESAAYATVGAIAWPACAALWNPLGLARAESLTDHGADSEMTRIDYDKHYARVYNDEAGRYDERRFTGRRGRFDHDYKNEVVLAVLGQHRLLGAGATIVDIAAGTGRITHYLAEHSSAKIIAADVSEEMLSVNRQTLPAHSRDRVEFKVMSMKKLDLPDRCADAVTIGSFFYLIPREDYDAYTSDVLRVLKPGGVLIADVSNALALINPRNFLRIAVRRHLRRKQVTSYVYPWEIGRLFSGFHVHDVMGASYPVVSRHYEIYARYSTLLGHSPGLKYLGGKCILVLRRP